MPGQLRSLRWHDKGSLELTRRRMRTRTRAAATTTSRRKTRAASGRVVDGELDPEKILRRHGRAATQRTRREQPAQALLPPATVEAGQAPAVTIPEPRSGVKSVGNAAENTADSTIRHTIENPFEGSFGQRTSSEESGFGYQDPLQVFYRRVGYLPPLSDAALDLLGSILLDPGVFARMARMSANKNLKDPAEKAYNDKLWALDKSKCTLSSQEPTFQRTMLISMIDRYRLIYEKGEHGPTTMLDFAAEGVWGCPPMPTMASRRLEDFLTQPKPDLAVAFRRQSLFPAGTNWNIFPTATQRLVCYEDISPPSDDRAFHFLTVEAKKSELDISDSVARAQSLNNASQALHNMYEFFREADDGKGEKFVDLFFDKVRFFSVVATSEGIKIRIYRACRISSGADKSADDYDQQGLDNPIRDDYPLKFLYSDYWTAHSPLNRQEVITVFAQILYGYGVGELAGYLRDAILEMDQKFQKYERNMGFFFQRSEAYYSHGQLPPLSRAASQNLRVQSQAATSTNASTSSI
ncbi:hypothetical protein M406DRAFT_349706 [Cryphonectria parasitica EP155]|uniref:DUF7924 domain-containing protein n=1 Tax=Cryphonectria parasitica (strain ATCC 38755 / EP155) TaxID=660469 RepID=A0A9P5CS62_CRYP1|nr:uncharacterized protein M406DRAFT_349706 [Cryphonectria parasitica EP155]KAF3768242.1 hypothetical protein M406DRAFT_349706 [Cryphonectria parasitica EP155]